MSARFLRLSLLLVACLLGQSAAQHGGSRPSGDGPRPPSPGGSFRGQPPGQRQPPEQKQRLGFAETMRVLEAARRITAQLKAGDVLLQASPQGPRLTLLLAGSQVVGSLLLDERGVIHPPADAPMLSDAVLPANLNALRPKLAAQVEALTLSGAVDVLPQGYGVTLLLGGQGVAQLRFAGGDLQPIPGRRPPSGPPRSKPDH